MLRVASLTHSFIPSFLPRVRKLFIFSFTQVASILLCCGYCSGDSVENGDSPCLQESELVGTRRPRPSERPDYPLNLDLQTAAPTPQTRGWVVFITHSGAASERGESGKPSFKS